AQTNRLPCATMTGSSSPSRPASRSSMTSPPIRERGTIWPRSNHHGSPNSGSDWPSRPHATMMRKLRRTREGPASETAQRPECLGEQASSRRDVAYEAILKPEQAQRLNEIMASGLTSPLGSKGARADRRTKPEDQCHRQGRL